MNSLATIVSCLLAAPSDPTAIGRAVAKLHELERLQLETLADSLVASLLPTVEALGWAIASDGLESEQREQLGMAVVEIASIVSLCNTIASSARAVPAAPGVKNPPRDGLALHN